MRKITVLGGAHVLCAAAVLALPVTPVRADPEPAGAQGFPVLPLPPVIEGLIGFPQTYTKGRGTYLALITSEAERHGLPAAMADAVVKVESGFNPYVVGGVGEVGLMQIRPETAAMLGYKDGLTGLFNPETNVRLGVAYLARAWDLAKGDVCRALMKYRAGWGEERMSPLSVEYCRRARGHLAAIGSPLAEGALPASTEPSTPFPDRQANKIVQAPSPGLSGAPAAGPSRLAASPSVQPSSEPVRMRAASLGTVKQSRTQAQAMAPASNPGTLAPQRQVSRLRPTAAPSTEIAAPPLPPARIGVASIGAVKLPSPQALARLRARELEKSRAERRRQIWATHNGRKEAAKLNAPQLKIMRGASTTTLVLMEGQLRDLRLH